MKTKEIEQTKTNDLRHEISINNESANIRIKIRLNDECKNGHQDFSITATYWEIGKQRADKYMIGGGCCHDEILRVCPELKIFVDLHLCDYKGIPMHATANGFYHLINGFNNTKPENKSFIFKYCEYYRISKNQFNELKTAKNVIQYAMKLDKLNILKQWEEQANEGIQLLEKMTGNVFIVDSKRTQYIAPTAEEIKEENERQQTGYYTKEAEQAREEAKRDGIIAELKAEADKEIKKAQTEFEVKKQVLIIGGEKALNNCIFYNHTNTLSFNWRGYDKISNELISLIIEKIQLPDGVTIENKDK